MIKITKYNGNKIVLIKFLEELRDYIIHIDPLKRFVRLPGYGERYADELIQQVSRQDGIIYIAEVENAPVGMVVGIIEGLSEKDLLECVPSKIGTVLELFVVEKYREKNIGSLLMDQIEKYFKGKNCDVIYVGMLEPNKRAHNFYQKKGYQDRIVNLMKQI